MAVNLIKLKPKIKVVASLKPKLKLLIRLPNTTIGSGNMPNVEFVASENILKYDLVTVDGFVADSNNLTHANKVLGMAVADTNTGFTGEAITYGEVVNPAWTWVIGDILFLNGTSLSTTPPSVGFSQEIAKALTPTSILIDLNEAIKL